MSDCLLDMRSDAESDETEENLVGLDLLWNLTARIYPCFHSFIVLLESYHACRQLGRLGGQVLQLRQPHDSTKGALIGILSDSFYRKLCRCGIVVPPNFLFSV